jgi:hypothetical protein
MWTNRKMIMVGAAAIAAGAAWLVESVGQENAGSGAGIVTVFDHARRRRLASARGASRRSAARGSGRSRIRASRPPRIARRACFDIGRASISGARLSLLRT